MKIVWDENAVDARVAAASEGGCRSASTVCKTTLQGSLRNILRRTATRCLPLLLLGLQQPIFGGSTAKAADNVATQSVIVPNESESVVGFGFTVPFMNGSRDLLIYHPSEFLPVMSLGAYVEKIEFRLDESIRGEQFRTYDVTGVEIRMSTSSSLATVVPSLEFSKNIGADETFVFGRSMTDRSAKPGSPKAQDLAYSLRKVPATGQSIDLAHGPHPTLSPKDPRYDAALRELRESRIQVAPLK